MSSPSPDSTSSSAIRELITFALAALEPMQLEDGGFCREKHSDDRGRTGYSLRYTVMVTLGLSRAAGSGYPHGRCLQAATEHVNNALAQSTLSTWTLGDLGLCMWLDRRVRGCEADRIAYNAIKAMEAGPRLETIEGMQLAWLAIGLALTLRDAPTKQLSRALATIMDQMIDGNQHRSGLMYHRGGGIRRRFPNFATQIYSALAFAYVAEVDGDLRAASAGRRLGDALIALQLENGGWPWIVDAARARVVEQYELYSVHQDAMAPMGLLKLSEVLDCDCYRQAALHGFEWIAGGNELSVDMFSADRSMLYRSIRRKPPWSRLVLYANSVTASIGRPIAPHWRGPLEINRSDRPYHLGWILEAWCGREDEGHARPRM